MKLYKSGGIKISVVEFNVSNIKRCLCPECPVQAESICIDGKKRIMAEIAWSSESGMYFEEDRVPGIYCSTGKAMCEDINPKKDVGVVIVKFGKNII